MANTFANVPINLYCQQFNILLSAFNNRTCSSPVHSDSAVNSSSFAFWQLHQALHVSTCSFSSSIHKLCFKDCNGAFIFYLPLLASDWTIFSYPFVRFSDNHLDIWSLCFTDAPHAHQQIFHWNSSNSCKKILTLICTKNILPPKIHHAECWNHHQHPQLIHWLISSSTHSFPDTHSLSH